MNYLSSVSGAQFDRGASGRMAARLTVASNEKDKLIAHLLALALTLSQFSLLFPCLLLCQVILCHTLRNRFRSHLFFAYHTVAKCTEEIVSIC